LAGTLYVVATPIGNLEDISFRALRTLKEADLIAAEDTRHTQKLLRHYDIHTPLTSYHEHNERAKARQLVQRMESGGTVALVSDAGTPAISDPGFSLVTEAVRAQIRVVPIPGACAATAVLSAGGLPCERFVFEGFLPAKRQQRRSRLQKLARETRTIVVYEAPHRLNESLIDMHEILGNRELVLAREVTKVHEQFVRGPLSELKVDIDAGAMRGEITIVIRGAAKDTVPTEAVILVEIRKLRGKGMRFKEIAELLGEQHGIPKKEVYRLAVAGEK